MVDFSKIFNIVFVSVCAALLLLFLISVIAVAAKGKRKCGAWDVILRILGTLVLIASAAMVACSILTMLNTADGGTYIVARQEGDVAAAWLVMSGKITKLPFPELFVALSTVIGFGLAAVLFILSLTVLIVDCLVANKKVDKSVKKGKKKEPAVKKSPEQLKREAELERIKRIGESAVRKTERVANAEKTENIQKDEDIAEASTAQSDEEDVAVDWREQSERTHSGFVGIKDGDDEFDSFDTFDGEQTEADEDNGVADDTVVESDGTDAPVEQSDERSDEYAAEQIDEQVDEQIDLEGQATEEIYYDADEQYTYDDGENGEESFGQSDVDEADEIEYDDGKVEDGYEYGQASDEQPIDGHDEAADEYGGDYAADQTEEAQADGEYAYGLPQTDAFDGGDDIEPDRGIYIPEIRTVTPRPSESNPSAAQKPTVKKTAAAKRTATKAAKPKKSGSGGVSQKPVGVVPPEKKLPVTRRYVILDRHNAVNMFGEYLKERNQAEKDKLKSSINTIIIE